MEFKRISLNKVKKNKAYIFWDDVYGDWVIAIVDKVEGIDSNILITITALGDNSVNTSPSDEFYPDDEAYLIPKDLM